MTRGHPSYGLQTTPSVHTGLAIAAKTRYYPHSAGESRPQPVVPWPPSNQRLERTILTRLL